MNYIVFLDKFQFYLPTAKTDNTTVLNFFLYFGMYEYLH